MPERLLQGLAQLLAARNGAYGFEGALHLLALDGEGDHDLAAWNADPAWREAYDGAADRLLVFAFDGFGGPFAMGPDGVVAFDPETGETEPLAPDIEGWAQALLEDYEVLTGHPLVRAWQVRHGRLPPNERLEPLRPFVLGGGFTVENLRACDLRTSLIRRGGLARAIKGAPDGQAVTWPPT